MKVLSGAAFLLLVSWMSFVNASPLESSSYDNVVYFADSESNSVERYSLATETFLTPLILTQNPLAIHVDASGIYASYGTQIVKLALDGSGEANFRTISQDITDIEATSQYLVLAGHGYIQIVNKTAGTLVDSRTVGQLMSLISVSQDETEIYFGSLGWSPAEIHRVFLGADGTLGGMEELPYHGDYAAGDDAQEFPGEKLIVDRSGNVYQTMGLIHVGDLGGVFSDIAFWRGLPLVLRENKVFSYNAWFQQTGVYQLNLNDATDLFVYQDKVFAFERVDADTPVVQVFDVLLATPADPEVALDPANLQYMPDDFALDSDGDTLYLLSKSHFSIFRWSLSQETYLETIPLTNVPDQFSYSPEQQRIYLSYADKSISYIDLVENDEKLFINVSNRIAAMTAAGSFLVTNDYRGGWGALNVYDSQGVQTDYQDWILSTNELGWNEATQTIYYLGDFYYPQRIALDSTGKLAEYTFIFGPYLDDGAPPLRMSEQGKYSATGGGQISDNTRLIEVVDLNSEGVFSDLVWMHGNLFTLDGIDNNTYTRLDRWRADFTRDISVSKEILGEPVGLIPVATMNKLLVIYRQSGKPIFEVFEFLETDFDNDGVSDSQDLFPVDETEAVDFDFDGIGDQTDTDDDNDGVEDGIDAFPKDSNESVDTDGDNTGNNADTDDDNDGVIDTEDRFPLDQEESGDIDNDDIGDNSDHDKDGDSIPNDQDAFPNDPLEWLDSDADDIGNLEDFDDDNDGVYDDLDWYPLDASESSDMDWDGIGDNSDPDRDGDSILNALDQFPNDPYEHLDTDLDGVGNNTDTDDDGDGVADNLDLYPLDASESKDRDGDGIGDNSDPDRDGDGVANQVDLFPNNSSEWQDSDGDGIGNNTDLDDDNDSVADTKDFYPVDASKSNINANDFFPLARGNRWLYEQYSAPVKPGADKKIANQTIMPLEFPYGHKVYLKVVNNQIQLFGFYFASVDVGFGPFSTDFMFNKGVDLMSTNSPSGKGTVNISPKYGKKDMSWSVSVNYLGSESLALPAGQYNGMHTRVSFTGSTTIDGQQLQLSYFVDYWFAEGVGLVQLSDNGGVMRLVSATITEPEVDNPDTPDEGGSGGGGGGSINYALLWLLMLFLWNVSVRENLKNRCIKRNA